MREEKCKAASRAEFEISLEEMSSDKKKVEKNIWGGESKRKGGRERYSEDLEGRYLTLTYKLFALKTPSRPPDTCKVYHTLRYAVPVCLYVCLRVSVCGVCARVCAHVSVCVCMCVCVSLHMHL